jgi:hypothetical protein
MKDTERLIVAVLVTNATACVDCIARTVGVPATTAARVLQRVREIVVLTVKIARCEGCERVTETYAISPKPVTERKGTSARARPPELAEALWQFLTEHRGEMFCTLCLTAALGVTRRIDRVLVVVEGRGARRQHRKCARCGQDRLLCGLAP